MDNFKRRLPIYSNPVNEIRVRRQDLAASHYLANSEVTCRKKCDNCCYHPMTISVAEGIILFEHLKKNHKYTTELRKSLESHSAKTIATAPEIWLTAKIPCPLLEGSLCTVYEARPLICRVTSSTGDPDLCHPHKFTEKTPLVPRLEVLEAYQTAETVALGKQAIKVPISTAILAAEKVVNGLDFSEVNNELVARYSEAIQ